MKYMGSKNRIAKYILPIMLEEANKKGITTWVEPFVGGGNMIDKVPSNFIRIGNDINEYIYSLLISLRDGWVPPMHINESMYNDIKNNKHKYEKQLVGYVGSQLTFGSTWFGTYRRDKVGKRDYNSEAVRNVISQSDRLCGIEFCNVNYLDLQIPNNSLIYCDPPYRGTFGYERGVSFNHGEFWEWCRDMSRKGHAVFISEYNAPEDFKCIWSMELKQVINNNSSKTTKPTEKLFILA